MSIKNLKEVPVFAARMRVDGVFSVCSILTDKTGF